MPQKNKYPNGLQAEMERRGIKQTTLARSMGVDRQQVGRYYHGEYQLTREWAERFAKALGSTPEILIFSDDAPDVLRVPLVSWVSAGSLIDGSSQAEAESYLPIAGLGRGDFFALAVRGDSMDLLSPDGSTIVVDRNRTDLKDGRAYVFRLDNETTYKLWDEGTRALLPYSSNKAHKPIPTRDADERFAVIGQVRRTMMDLKD